MRTIVVGALCMSLLMACENQDFKGNEEIPGNNLRVEAEIAASGAHLSRTSTTESGTVTFASGDRIGFYMPEDEQSGAWTFVDEVWTSDKTYSWPDKAQTYNFCAYYPFTASEARTAITMPDLSTQTGTLAGLKTLDFLAARCEASYSTKSGVVSFTGEQSFKHVYAMMVVNLRTNAETKGSVLTDLTLKSEGIVSPHTYHFGMFAEGDGMTLAGGAVGELALSNLETEITTLGIKQYLIVNPLPKMQDVEITIQYTREGQTYTASTKVSAATVQEGNLNKLNILVKKSGLVIEGNTVEDWTENDLGDLSVEENKVS